MRTIYKYPLDVTDFQHVTVPEGSRLLKVAYDPKGQLSGWFEVEPNLSPVLFPIWIFGTGQRIDACNPEHTHVQLEYFDTFQGRGEIGSNFIWHVYTRVV